MLSLFQNLYERNTDNEPHPLKTEQYQLRVALSSLDNAKSARRARWFKSIIVKNPSYKQRHRTNWMDGWHQRNQTHKKDKVNSGPYFIRALQWNNKVTVSTIFGEQGWSSGESTCVPTMWPRFKSRRPRHTSLSLLLAHYFAASFLSRYFGFPLYLTRHSQIPIRQEMLDKEPICE